MIFHEHVGIDSETTVILKESKGVEYDLCNGGVAEERQPVDCGCSQEIWRSVSWNDFVSGSAHEGFPSVNAERLCLRSAAERRNESVAIILVTMLCVVTEFFRSAMIGCRVSD